MKNHELDNVGNIWNILKAQLKVLIPDLKNAKLLTAILDIENRKLQVTENGATFYDVEVNKNQFSTIRFLIAGKIEKGKKAKKIFVTFDYEVERKPGITILHTDESVLTLNI